MKKYTVSRRIIIILTGMLFAAYSAYNVFIIFRGMSSLSAEGIFISACVALLFAVFAVWAWTGGVNAKEKPDTPTEQSASGFLMASSEEMLKGVWPQIIRRTAFILALFAVFALKLRVIPKVIAYVDFSQVQTVLYGVEYFLTLAGLLILVIYYAFIRKRFMIFHRASVMLPIIAMILFIGALTLDIILFFGYGLLLEASPLRTMVMRPVFYLGFIGLTVYFLFPLQPLTDANQSLNNIEDDAAVIW